MKNTINIARADPNVLLDEISGCQTLTGIKLSKAYMSLETYFSVIAQTSLSGGCHLLSAKHDEDSKEDSKIDTYNGIDVFIKDLPFGEVEL